MSANDERRLARLRARFLSKAQELSELGFVMRGSILERFSRCGSAGCGCHDEPPRLHGPYWQWTAKLKGKTVTRNLSDDQVKRYRQWMDNAQRVDRIVQELYDVSAEADLLLRSLEREADAPKKKPKKPKKPKKGRSRSRRAHRA